MCFALTDTDVRPVLRRALSYTQLCVLLLRVFLKLIPKVQLCQLRGCQFLISRSRLLDGLRPIVRLADDVELRRIGRLGNLPQFNPDKVELNSVVCVVAYAKSMGFEMDRVFVEAGISGGKGFSTRPKGTELDSQLRPGDIVVATKLDPWRRAEHNIWWRAETTV